MDDRVFGPAQGNPDGARAAYERVITYGDPRLSGSAPQIKLMDSSGGKPE
jgi:hypothetical protein